MDRISRENRAKGLDPVLCNPEPSRILTCNPSLFSPDRLIVVFSSRVLPWTVSPRTFCGGCVLLMMFCLAGLPRDARAQQPATSPEQARTDTTAAAAFVPEHLVRRVTDAFRQGDARQLLETTAERIDVGLPGARAYYSRSQAVYVLRAFFQKHPPQRFEVGEVSKASSSYFVTGRYWYAQGEQPMRVYTRFATEETDPLQEIRVEPLRQ